MTEHKNQMSELVSKLYELDKNKDFEGQLAVLEQMKKKSLEIKNLDYDDLIEKVGKEVKESEIESALGKAILLTAYNTTRAREFSRRQLTAFALFENDMFIAPEVGTVIDNSKDVSRKSMKENLIQMKYLSQSAKVYTFPMSQLGLNENDGFFEKRRFRK